MIRFFLISILLFISSLVKAHHISFGKYESFDSLFALAEKGDIDAQIRLGKDYYDHGAIDDARYWLNGPAKSGNIDAQYELANTFLGWGIDTENEKAIFWLTLAAEKGHEKAMYTLSSYYFNGSSGFPKDQKKSKYWAKQARDNSK